MIPMAYLDAALVVFLIALSVSFLMRGVWKKSRKQDSSGCAGGSCGCSAKKEKAAARE